MLWAACPGVMFFVADGLAICPERRGHKGRNHDESMGVFGDQGVLACIVFSCFVIV